MHKHLSFDERVRIEEGLIKGYSLNKITSFLNRSQSTIAREVHRNRIPFHPKKILFFCKDNLLMQFL